MTINSERQLKTGGDPRTLADYAALREEMNKLTGTPGCELATRGNALSVTVRA